MEETNSIKGLKLNVSEQISLNDYFMHYKELLKTTLFSNQGVLESLNTEEEKIAFQLGIDMDEYHNLEQCCSISLLQSDPLELDNENNPRDGLLEKASKFLETAVELKALKSCELKYENKLKELRRTAIPQFEQEPSPSDKTVMLHDNFVVIARVFRPHGNNNMDLSFAPQAQDFMLLGSTNLCEFRDLLMCVNDEVVLAEIKEKNKEESTSNAFFFGHFFYSDGRSLRDIQNGALVEKLVKENLGMPTGPFEHKNMEDHTIGDLKIRLGFPYFYIHLGYCEHIITFLDARFMTSEDLQNLDEYPLVVESGNNFVSCGICDAHESSYYVEDDSMPTKPMNLCDNCFSTFYKKDGKIPPISDEFFYRKLPANETARVQPQEEEESEDD